MVSMFKVCPSALLDFDEFFHTSIHAYIIGKIMLHRRKLKRMLKFGWKSSHAEKNCVLFCLKPSNDVGYLIQSCLTVMEHTPALPIPHTPTKEARLQVPQKLIRMMSHRIVTANVIKGCLATVQDTIPESSVFIILSRIENDGQNRY